MSLGEIPSPSATELDTFKVFANSDYVDLTRTSHKKPAVVGGFGLDSGGQGKATAFEEEMERLGSAPAPSRTPTPEQTPRRAPPTPPPHSLAPNDSGPRPSPYAISAPINPEEDDALQFEMLAAQLKAEEASRGRNPTPPRNLDDDVLSVGSARSARSIHSVHTSVSQREERARRAFRRPEGPDPRVHREGRDPGPERERRDENENTVPEIVAEKEALLAELRSLVKQGAATLSREFSMADSLQSLQFEYERIQSDLGASQTVEMAKGGIKMGIGVLEMVAKRQGMTSIDGWYASACGDMSKYNRPLHRLYKKYWRRAPSSPMMELAFLIFGSAAWTVMQNKMGLGPPSRATSPSGASSDRMANTTGMAGASGAGAHVHVQPRYEPPSSNAGAGAGAGASAGASAPTRPMRPPQVSGITVGSSWVEAAGGGAGAGGAGGAAGVAATGAGGAASLGVAAPTESSELRSLRSHLEETRRQQEEQAQRIGRLGEEIQARDERLLEALQKLASVTPAPAPAPALAHANDPAQSSALSESDLEEEESASDGIGVGQGLGRVLKLKSTPSASSRRSGKSGSRNANAKRLGSTSIIRVGP